MEHKQFDALAKGLAGSGSRRGMLKGMLAAVAGLAGVNRLAEADAASGTTLTIHNATCAKALTGTTIYDSCHANGFGCADFYFRGRRVRTNAKGRATASIGAGTLTLGQQKSLVAKSKGIYVFCAAKGTGRVLFEGRADGGDVKMTVRSGEQVICDWYNITKQDLALPQLCKVSSGTTTAAPGTTTTTVAPTTTTTTTTPDPDACPEGGIWVEPGVDTLSAAVNAAATGSILCLRAGSYSASSGTKVAHIQNKTLTILGYGSTGANASIIEGAAGRDGLFVQSGLTIKNTRFNALSHGIVGSLVGAVIVVEKCYFMGDLTTETWGVSVNSYSTVTIRKSTITKCRHAVEATVAYVTLEDVTITENGTVSSVVIPISYGGTLTMDATTTIFNNVGSQVIRASDNGVVTMNGSNFSGNTAALAAIVLSQGTFVNNGGTIKDNTSSSKGGIALLYTTVGSPKTNTFTDNNGSYSGNNGGSHGCDAVWDGTNCCVPSNSSCSTS